MDNPREYLSFAEWNAIQGVSLHTPLIARRMHKQSKYNVTWYNGNTLFSNCYQQDDTSSNPAHWMMKLGLLYELTICFSRNKDNVFRDKISLPFRQMYMHQCADPFSTKWLWGSTLFDIVARQMIANNIINAGTKYISTGYISSKEKPEKYFHCFEDIYLSRRNGIWLQLPFNHVSFRKDAAAVTGEPVDAITKPESEIDTLPIGSDQLFCPSHSSKVSTARIKIFQRSGTKFLRKFLNIVEVIVLAQSYTSVPVEVVTVNDTSSIKDQIRLFNSFDILITSHGSHLANGVFTMNPSRKAVIEVVPFAFDRVFYGNYNYLGFAYYMMSTGHTTPNQSPDSNANPTSAHFLHCKICSLLATITASSSLTHIKIVSRTPSMSVPISFIRATL